MGGFVKVAKAVDVVEGQIFMVEIGQKEIALFNLNGSYFALDNKCTHLGGPLCEGVIDGDEVVCPWHGARFQIATGEVTEIPAPIGLETFPTRVIEGDLEIEL